MKTIDQLTDAEITRIAAEDVMGWTRQTEQCWWRNKVTIQKVAPPTFSPLTDANDDAMVRDRVKKWCCDDRKSFKMARAKIRSVRHNGGCWGIYEETGDDTRAAVAVILAIKEKKDAN